MKRNTFYGIAAGFAFLFGLVFLLFPEEMMVFYGTQAEAAGAFLGRYFGSCLFGVSVILWYARNAEESKALLAINFGALGLTLTGLVVALMEALSGIGNVWVWSTVVIYTLLVIGFGWFHFKK